MKEFTRKFSIVIYVCIIACVWACTPEEELFTSDPAAKLSFSENAVVFDTVYTALPTITRWLTVYNPNKRALSIEQVFLGNQLDSPYEVTVNGRPLANARNLRLLGGDSLLVLVKAAINPRNESSPFVVYDSLTFQTNGNLQNVKLLAWGQDVNFVTYKDFSAACNTTWDSLKPYVIIDSIRVPAGCKLTMEAGTEVYSRTNATIIVEGSLEAAGTPEEKVILADFRQLKENAPGQWGGIVFKKTSNNNIIRGTEIRNANIGIDVQISDEDTIPDLIVESSIIKNMLESGIRTLNSDIALTNSLITNCVAMLVEVRAGGNYTFNHCTLANYSFDFSRIFPSIQMSNGYKNVEEGTQLTSPLLWDLQNSVIWGSAGEEIFIDRQPSAGLTITASNNLLKTGRAEVFTGSNNILNAALKHLFVDPEILDFRPDTLSPLIDAGGISGVTQDITGKQRDQKPDIGAYER